MAWLRRLAPLSALLMIWVTAGSCASAGHSVAEPAEEPQATGAPQPTGASQAAEASQVVQPAQEPEAEGSKEFDWRALACNEPTCKPITLNVALPRYPMFQVWDGVYLLTPQFERETGIRVAIQTLDESVYSTFTSMFLKREDQDSDGIHVFVEVLNNEGYTDFKKGRVQALDGFISDPGWTAPGYDVDDFYPRMLADAKYEGQIYSIPALFEAYILMYNKRMLGDDSVPETMSDLIAKAQEVTEEQSRFGHFGVLVRGEVSSGNLDAVAGVALNSFGKERAPQPWNLWFNSSFVRPRLTAPPVATGLVQYAELVKQGPRRRVDWETASRLFEQNKALFFVDASQFTVYFEAIDSTIRNHVGYLPLPVSEGHDDAFTGFWQLGFAIPGNIRNEKLRKAAWYFIQYMTNHRGSPVVGMFTAGPTRRSTWEDPYYTRTLNREYLETMRGILGSSLGARTTTVRNVKFDEMATVIMCAVAQMSCGILPKKALPAADEKLKCIAQDKEDGCNIAACDFDSSCFNAVTDLWESLHTRTLWNP